VKECQWAVHSTRSPKKSWTFSHHERLPMTFQQQDSSDNIPSMLCIPVP